MGRYSGILLCSDFDGTLSHDGAVSKENMDAIRTFMREGGLFSVASGRYYDFLLPFFHEIELTAPIVALNGAVFYDTKTKTVLREKFMTGLTPEYAREIFDTVDGVNEIVFYTKDGFVHVAPDDIESIARIDLKKIYKLSVRVEADKEISDRATKALRLITPKGYDVARSWYWGIEVEGIECTKGPATRELARMLGAHTLVCVGDFENDISMVKGADIGYAVGGSIEGLLAVADRVTVPVEEHAIAKIISEL